MSQPRLRGRTAPRRSAGALLLATMLLLATALAPASPALARKHSLTGPSPAPSVAPARVVASVDTTEKVIALTFDDGWDADRCLSIADTLDRYAIPATFFPNGVYVRNARKVWRSIGARFPIGNHTYHHPDLRGLSVKDMAHELEKNRRLIESITGRPMAPLLRPPYGAVDDKVARVAGSLGYRWIVEWDTSDGDTGPNATARGVAKGALRGGPGSIVLLHCGPELTPQVLPIVIERYTCQGFRFATVEELLAGSQGHRAKVDCPPLPLPDKRHRRGADPSPGPGVMPTMDPGISTVGPTIVDRWVGSIRLGIDRLIEATAGLMPPPSTAADG